jgi:hypothetical protein
MRTSLTALAVLTVLTVPTACRGEPPQSSGAGATPDQRLARLVDSLRAPVEEATGLRFRAAPRSAVRTREQLRAYLTAKLDEEFPPERARGIETAYRLFGMIPDTLELRPLLLDLLTEQVVGFYEPDSAMLFGVGNAPEDEVRIMAAHELVHALQGQYLNLDSILSTRGDNDRSSAAQAILEGQAMVASIRAITPGMDVLARPEVWELFRQQARDAQSAMPRFAAAPLVVREGLIFPYLEGSDFMRWWAADTVRNDTVPFGPRMPVSTEQVLHPERYARGDQPLDIALPPSADPVIHEDALGELEIRILGATLAGRGTVAYDPPLGWAGDRYRVTRTPAGPALVWHVAFDDPASAERFAQSIGRRLEAQRRPDYTTTLERTTIAGRPGFVFRLEPIRQSTDQARTPPSPRSPPAHSPAVRSDPVPSG